MLDGASFVFDDDCEFVVDDAEDVDLANLTTDLDLTDSGMRENEAE